MKAPKILAVASAVDLDFRYGCTPAWWQLWKGLYEVGVDLIVTPYRGRPVESPWWRTAPNPTRAEGESFAAVRAGLARVKGDRYLRRAEDTPDESAFDKVARETIWRWVTPRWRRHLTRVLEAEKDVDAVVVFTVPMAHFRGIPSLPARALRRARVFYDGDVPMSLPEFGGMDTGFNYYHGADPSEYDLVVSNSEGGLERLRELGRPARGGGLLGRRPGVLRAAAGREGARRLLLRLRRQVPPRLDGGDGRRAEPSRPGARVRPGRPRLPGRHGPRVARRRRSLQCLRAGDLGRADQPEHHPAFTRERVRVLVGPPVRARGRGGRDRLEPVRGDRALVRARARSCSSSTTRDEALAAYRELLDDPAQAEAMGARARERVLDEHTYAHRARQLLSLVGLGVPAGARA